MRPRPSGIRVTSLGGVILVGRGHSHIVGANAQNNLGFLPRLVSRLGQKEVHNFGVGDTTSTRIASGTVMGYLPLTGTATRSGILAAWMTSRLR